MKKILIALMTLGSLSAFASDSICRFDVSWIPHVNQGEVRSAKIIFKNAFSEKQCREEAKLGAESEYIIRVTDSSSDHIVKTKYKFKSDSNQASGTYKHGIWK